MLFLSQRSFYQCIQSKRLCVKQILSVDYLVFFHPGRLFRPGRLLGKLKYSSFVELSAQDSYSRKVIILDRTFIRYPRVVGHSGRYQERIQMFHSLIDFMSRKQPLVF